MAMKTASSDENKRQSHRSGIELKDSTHSSSLSSSSSGAVAVAVEAKNHEEKDANPKQKFRLLHPTYSLPLLVMIDMFSVSLVVPLLMQYYKNAGVTSASQRELLSSLFSSSQIVGGLLLGALADAGILQRRTILLVSFGGSAVAYAFILYGNIYALIASRILVGLVKQTMTVSTTLLARYTSNEHRTKHMGRLTASSTAAWIAGPSVGAFLYRHVDVRAPAFLAVALFCLNMVLAAIMLPAGEEGSGDAKSSRIRTKQESTDGSDTKENGKKDKKSNKFSSFSSNLKTCFQSPALGSVIVSLLLFSWFRRATSYATMASYYEEMYDMEPHQRGYLSSYQACLNFIVQSVFIGPLLSGFFANDERKAATFAAVVMGLATLCEMQGNIYVLLLIVCPAISCGMSVLNLSLRSLVTHVAPPQSLGSVLAALDVLQNAAAVTVPFYRTLLFRLLSVSKGGVDDHAMMMGDPDPVQWVLSSSIHWMVAAVAMGMLLLRPEVPLNAKKEKTKAL